ncbi:MAG: flagellar motor switch protein FliM [Candidatus Competibacteraceae bacterium]|nr:flagellar motor switch protein FliM [Candidatus Competibacteraceae bacterium]
MSSDEVLTQDERDALMEAVSNPTDVAETPASASHEGVMPYDLAGQDYAVNSLLPVLETIHERFAHRLRIGLFEMVRRELTVNVSAIEKRGYTDLTTSLSVPCSVNLIGISPLSGPALLIFDTDLIFLIVDTFFGGSGRSYQSASVRDFTTTENRFIQRLLQLCFRSLEEAWSPFAALKCSHLSSENKPQFVTSLNPNEPLTVSSATISRDSIAGAMHLALPYSILEPIRETLLNSTCKEHPNPSRQLAERLREGLQESQIEVRCALAGFELSLSDLLALRIGDVIPVNIPPTAVLQVEEVPVYSGSYGVAQGWSALKIEQPLGPAGEWLNPASPAQDFAPFAAKP